MMTSRPRERSDVRGDFDCGEPSFNDFLRRYAGQNQSKSYVGVTGWLLTSAAVSALGPPARRRMIVN